MSTTIPFHRPSWPDFTQVVLYNESVNQIPAGRHHRYQITAIICAVLSLAGFSVGACVAA